MNPWLIPPSRLARLTVLRTQSDERLMFLMRQGSEPAFEAIVQRYRRALVRHCGRVLGSSDAEEAVQDALVNAHAALARGADVRSLGPWLHTVAHNAALAILRRRSARHECPHEEINGHSVVDAPHAIRAELQELVRAVQSLPPRQRDAIVMRELEGRSYSEIAARLGATDGAVRQLLNRARIAMRKSLGALIPAGPLTRWMITTGDGGSAITAKLSGAAVISAVSAIALLPSAHRPATSRAGGTPASHPRRVEAAHAPRRAAAHMSLLARQVRASAPPVPVRAVRETRANHTTAHPKTTQSQPRSTAPLAGSIGSDLAAPTGNWATSTSGVAGSGATRPTNAGGWSTTGGGWPTGSPDQQHQQPVYEMPMQQPASSWPTSQQNPTP